VLFLTGTGGSGLSGTELDRAVWCRRNGVVCHRREGVWSGRGRFVWYRETGLFGTGGAILSDMTHETCPVQKGQE
jgi:hypothetical protein